MRIDAGIDGAVGSVQAVDVRTGRLVSVFVEGGTLQVLAPDRTSGPGFSVTEVGADEIVLAGPVSGRVAGRRGAWAITRAVSIDDPRWGASAPAWSWLLVPDDTAASRRSADRFLAELRAALPRSAWTTIRLSRAAREGSADASAELVALARRRDPAFAATCAEVSDERGRRAAGQADRAERVLRDSLTWRTANGLT
jgi:hypothetical protein